VVDAGALTKIFSLTVLPSPCSSLLRSLALRSEELCQVILSGGLGLLMMHVDWETCAGLLELVKKASVAQLAVAFSVVSSAIKTEQAKEDTFKFLLVLFESLVGARKADLVLHQSDSFWIQDEAVDLSPAVIQSLIDAGIIEAILKSVVSVDDRTIYQVCCDILLVFSCNAQHIVMTVPLLEAFASFDPRGPRRGCSLKVLFHCVGSLSDIDSHLPLIERSGLIQAVFSQEISDGLLMQVQKMMDRALDNVRSGFFDHLVSCGLISVLVSAYKYKSRLKVVCGDEIVACLVRIMRAGEEYKRLVDEMKLPRLLVPLLTKAYLMSI
jgi:hypothetical protein